MSIVYIVHTPCIGDIFILLLNSCTFVTNKLRVTLFYSSQYSGYYYRPHNFTEVELITVLRHIIIYIYIRSLRLIHKRTAYLTTACLYVNI